MGRQARGSTTITEQAPPDRRAIGPESDRRLGRLDRIQQLPASQEHDSIAAMCGRIFFKDTSAQMVKAFNEFPADESLR